MFQRIQDLFSRNQEQSAEREFLEGFHGLLESEKERAKMSPAMLAIRLSSCDKESPAYILLGYELNRRIAQIQSRASYVGTVSAVFGVVFGAFLQASLSLQNPQPVVQCLCLNDTEQKSQGTTDKPESLRAAPIKPAVTPLSGKTKNEPATEKQQI